MVHKKNIVWFEEVGKKDVGLVGGKGANLGEMTTSRLPIPYGFVVTSVAYFNFIKENKLDKKIKDILSITNTDNPHELQQASDHIQKLILDTPISHELVKEVIEYYEQLTLKEERYFSESADKTRTIVHKIKNLYHSPLVAVRSSATAEDLPSASFAGQQETYLNVQGENHLLKKIHECWASLFTQRAIYYRHEQGFDHFRVGLAAVVQRMIQSDKSGIAFSIDPVTNDKNRIVIEAIFGLGEYIVQGKVTPDHYEVDKHSFVLLREDVKYQNLKYIKAGRVNKEIKLNKSAGSQKKLNHEEIIKLAFLVKDIENHYYFPQDIEWAIEKDKVFIVQSRPITTIKNVGVGSSDPQLTGGKTPPLQNKQPILTGAPASPGIGVGPVSIIHSPKEIFKIHKDDILVAPQTNPDYVPAMKKAGAIVTEKGGRTSHAAIVSRELGIPAVVGAEHATRILKQGNVISVNGGTGEIFNGSVIVGAQPASTRWSNRGERDAPKKQLHHRFHTLTKVYVNLAEVEQAEKVSKMDTDGIGLLRAEFMIAGIGTHPREFIRHRQEKLFINELVKDLLKFVKPFAPRPIVYRATDFKTNEYRHLKGGEKYEPKEENPMIGFRGASRYIANPEVFSMELSALKKIWEMGYTNLHLMIPFVRVPWELIKIKELVQKSGLTNYPHFKLLIMVEVPACALALEEFIRVGVDGISIGTNDLTMMLLGVDRDNEEVANIYDERNPIIETVLEYVIKTASVHGITSSICGQAASDYPDLVEKLVKAGITSVSVNPDAVDRTRELIYNIEKKHFNSVK